MIAASIRILRQHAEVETADPDALVEGRTRCEPEVVICSRGLCYRHRWNAIRKKNFATLHLMAWNGSLFLVHQERRVLARLEEPPYEVRLAASKGRRPEAEKNVLSAVDAVAGRLGSTRDIARSSYIIPRLVAHYMEGSMIAYYGELVEEIIAAEQGAEREGEEALLDLLTKKLHREMRRAAWRSVPRP